MKQKVTTEISFYVDVSDECHINTQVVRVLELARNELNTMPDSDLLSELRGNMYVDYRSD